MWNKFIRVIFSAIKIICYFLHIWSAHHSILQCINWDYKWHVLLEIFIVTFRMNVDVEYVWKCTTFTGQNIFRRMLLWLYTSEYRPNLSSCHKREPLMIAVELSVYLIFWDMSFYCHFLWQLNWHKLLHIIRHLNSRQSDTTVLFIYFFKFNESCATVMMKWFLCIDRLVLSTA